MPSPIICICVEWICPEYNPLSRDWVCKVFGIKRFVSHIGGVSNLNCSETPKRMRHPVDRQLPIIREIRVIRDNPRFAAYSPKCDLHSDKKIFTRRFLCYVAQTNGFLCYNRIHPAFIVGWTTSS